MKTVTITSDKNHAAREVVRKTLIVCGMLSSLIYVFMNVITAMHYPGYNVLDQTVSELSAIDAPTRQLWVALGIGYGVLVVAFGYGVWLTGNLSRPLRIAGILLLVDGIVGFFWPPMHQREVIAAGGGTLTDTLHIAFTMLTVPLMILTIVFGALAFGRGFRVYSFVTLLVLLFFGILTGLDGSNISQGRPTPLLGVWERINIGAYMVWIIVFSIILLPGKQKPLGRSLFIKT
jgi:hypothetical protein